MNEIQHMIGRIEFNKQQAAANATAQADAFRHLIEGQRFQQGKPMFDGSKPIVVCGGDAKEAKDMDAAQALAESLAHSKGADAYILKPVRKVAPKRDVVTTDIV